MDRATILTLDYGKDDQQQDNHELGVVMCSARWTELVDLLTDPVCYVRKVQESFEYLNDSSTKKPAWEICSPVTAILESGYLNRAHLTQFAMLMNLHVSGFNLLAIPKGKDSRASFYEALQSAFYEEFKDGAFQAEFSVKTKTLFIRYFQPLTQPHTTIYDQDFSRATVSAPLGLFDQALASTHFDLVSKSGGRVSPADRARFITAYLQNPKEVCDRLNSNFDDKPLMKCVSTMYSAGARDVKVQPVEEYPAMSFTTKSQCPKEDAWPKLVVEGLYQLNNPCDQKAIDPSLIEPCTNYSTTVSGNQLILGDGVIKTY